jgi:ubiquinol-cytochrome c reductase cytochrome b subunit
VTPDHLTPAWYFGAFYAILRAIPDKLLGVIGMFGAVAMLFALPWLDRSKVRSIRYKGLISKVALGLFTLAFIALSWFGMQPPSEIGTIVSRLATIIYFAFFLLMPWYSKLDKTKPEPERVTYEAH